MSLMMAEPETRVASALPAPSGIAANISAVDGTFLSMPSWRMAALSGFAAFHDANVACHAS